MTEDDTFLRLKRRIHSKEEMNRISHDLFPIGSEVADLVAWLESEGRTWEDWKQTERDKKVKRVTAGALDHKNQSTGSGSS